ncbi:putative isomerase YbhE [Daldinia caldariorum]|uniref:putative isomerase YbhE n=1 Tax=Daldinia caldariorum TaxID=326644 RepID=UPI002007A62B|nr:putative isomerase YbhE [Daldinia caldariorum]KAI1465178.1 putative isomerase YbhE [Daldinia caldariorum]
MKGIIAALLLGTASAMPSLTPREDAPAAAPRKLVLSTPFQILTADFDGSKFSITGNHTAAGTGPSWLLFKEPNLLYAVNENANDTSLFTLDSGKPTLASAANGTSGVVFLEFNSDKTRMVGAGYGSGAVDVWDVSAADGSLKHIKTVLVPGEPNPAQGAHHPHQALLDPTGRYFVIPNLGGDTVLVLDSKDDRYEFTGNATLPTGTGPRHGGFISDGDDHYYALASELSSELFLFKLTYTEDSISFKQLQKQSTYGAVPPANATSAAAGELVVAANQRDVYVSNRISGNETDSIAHFQFKKGTGKCGAAHLDFADTVSSGGLRPRMFSLSKDETLAFVTNQGGDNGLLAFKRNKDSGSLDPTPVATYAYKSLVAPELAATDLMGPQFIQEI